MATITSGNTATGTLGVTDSVTISTRGAARFECPTGTRIAEFSGTRTFGPYDNLTYTITAVAGPLEYEVADGSLTAPITGTAAESAAFHSLVSRDGILRQEALSRFYGCSGTDGLLQQDGTQSNLTRCISVKEELEGHITGTRLVHINRSANNSLDACRAVVFVTESPAIDTSYGLTLTQNTATPVVGGAAYAQLAPAGTVNGFQPITWPGQEILTLTNSTTTATLTTKKPHGLSTGHTVDVTGCDLPNYNVTAAAITVTSTTAFTYVMAADPGASPGIIGSYSSNAVGTRRAVRPPTYTGGQAGAVQTYSRSNKAALTSLPTRLDGGSRPLRGYRFFHDGAVAGQKFPFHGIPVGVGAATAAMRNRIIQIGVATSDAVGTLGATFFANQTTFADLYCEDTYVNPVLSVWDSGDSTKQQDALVTDKVSTAMNRACKDVSTLARPVVYANFGASSQTSATCFAQVKAALEAGLAPPSVIAAQYYSVNDGVLTDAIVQTSKQLALDWIALCKQYGVSVLWFTPSMPWNTLNAAQYALNVALDSWVSALATAQGFVVYMPWTGLSDGANPERWASGLSGDGTHPTEPTIESVIAPQYATVLRRLVA